MRRDACLSYFAINSQLASEDTLLHEEIAESACTNLATNTLDRPVETSNEYKQAIGITTETKHEKMLPYQ